VSFNLRSRLIAVQKRLGPAFQQRACPTCGYPRTAVRLYITTDELPPRLCETCSRPLTMDGQPLLDEVKRIILAGEDEPGDTGAAA
jgi:hypothetical protein